MFHDIETTVDDWFSFQDDEGVGDVTTLEALLAPASDFPGYDAMGGEDWEREEDPDLVDEPVLQLDMQVRTSIFPSFSFMPLPFSHFHPGPASLCNLKNYGVFSFFSPPLPPSSLPSPPRHTWQAT